MATLSPAVTGRSGRLVGIGVKNDNFSTTSASYVDVTGLHSISIICPQNVLVRLVVTGGISNATSGSYAGIKMLIDGYPLMEGGVYRSAQGADSESICLEHLHLGFTPNTTHVFQVQMAAYAGGTAVLTASLSADAILSVWEV